MDREMDMAIKRDLAELGAKRRNIILDFLIFTMVALFWMYIGYRVYRITGHLEYGIIVWCGMSYLADFGREIRNLIEKL